MWSSDTVFQLLTASHDKEGEKKEPSAGPITWGTEWCLQKEPGYFLPGAFKNDHSEIFLAPIDFNKWASEPDANIPAVNTE